jgi:hypothetical protein
MSVVEVAEEIDDIDVRLVDDVTLGITGVDVGEVATGECVGFGVVHPMANNKISETFTSLSILVSMTRSFLYFMNKLLSIVQRLQYV